jgi:hypothetical protein
MRRPSVAYRLVRHAESDRYDWWSSRGVGAFPTRCGECFNPICAAVNLGLNLGEKALSSHEEKFGIRSLESFFTALADRESVAVEIRERFRERAPSILGKLKEGVALVGDEIGAGDIIHGLVTNGTDIVDTIEALDPYGEPFEIDIMKYGPVYWIQVPEFDNTEYFDSQEKANRYAESMYQQFTAWNRDERRA